MLSYSQPQVSYFTLLAHTVLFYFSRLGNYRNQTTTPNYAGLEAKTVGKRVTPYNGELIIVPFDKFFETFFSCL